jgi:hypothetical protein
MLSVANSSLLGDCLYVTSSYEQMQTSAYSFLLLRVQIKVQDASHCL